MRRAALTLLLAAVCNTAKAESGPGFSIELPPGWSVHRDVGEAPLLARPPEAAIGWGKALLTVDSRHQADKASCLDGQFQRRLRQLQKRAEHFDESDERRFTLDGQAAYEIALRYRLGTREFGAYLLMVEHQGRIASALVTADPAAFELHRAELRRLVETLRVKRYAGADYVPPKAS